MSKGIASRNSLKALAYPIQRFIAGWGAKERPSHSNGTGSILPAPYELAALRGEGVLRERFFQHFMAKIPVELNAEQQITLWNELVEEGGQVTAWVQRLGIAKALRREAVIPINATHESRKLYCLLLDTLANQDKDLLPWAVDGYFWHVWKAQFPQTPAAGKTNITQAEVLRDQLVRILRKMHQETVEVKESFREEDEQVQFALLAKRPSLNRWEELARVERPRLKTARLAAYDAALSIAASSQSPK
jgi:aryl carrier-like protein